VAKSVGVAPEQVTVGCGSVSLCYDLAHITCSGPGDEVVMAWRSFEAYPIATRVAGATPVQVPLSGAHVHDLDAMAAAVGDRTRLVFVCNPNNPTGTAVGRAALERFLDTVPPEVLVVLDEAYIEYLRLDADDRPDGIEPARTRPNVVVLRTFSKAYGLAGLRVGYAVGDPTVITALNKVHVPFSVGSLAQAAAIASLEAREELLERTQDVVVERSRVREGLVEAGYEVPVSETNFIWLPLAARTTAFAEAAERSRLLVRAFAGDGVRVTIGTPQENDAFLRFARDPAVAERFTR
jgi:histidinol-phosphate aminotransferase